MLPDLLSIEYACPNGFLLWWSKSITPFIFIYQHYHYGFKDSWLYSMHFNPLLFLLYMYKCVCMYLDVQIVPGTHVNQKCTRNHVFIPPIHTLPLRILPCLPCPYLHLSSCSILQNINNVTSAIPILAWKPNLERSFKIYLQPFIFQTEGILAKHCVRNSLD